MSLEFLQLHYLKIQIATDDLAWLLWHFLVKNLKIKSMLDVGVFASQ